ncbi:hypothetical protein B7494_g5642 [Chlorociboria aeruginascens]|nr:hypothetical protein B7494_g5642 [Chlorociboria aeruginascens]
MQYCIQEELRKLSSTRRFLEDQVATFESSETKVSSQIKSTKKDMDAVLEEIKTLREDLKTRVGEGLQGLSVAAKRISAEVISELSAFQNQLHGSYSSLGRDLKSLFDDLVEHINAQKAEANELRQQLNAASDIAMQSNAAVSNQLENLKAANKHSSLLQSTTSSVYNETVRIVDDQMKDIAFQMQALDGFVTRARSQNAQHYDQNSKSLGGLTIAVRTSYTNIDSQFNSTYERVKDLGDDMSDRHIVLQEYLASIDNIVCEPLADLQANIFNKTLEECQPTGQTLQRVSYLYQTELPRTGDHETILTALQGEVVSGDSGITSPSKHTTTVFHNTHDNSGGEKPQPMNQTSSIETRAMTTGGLRELDVNINAGNSISSEEHISSAKNLTTDSSLASLPHIPNFKRNIVFCIQKRYTLLNREKQRSANHNTGVPHEIVTFTTLYRDRHIFEDIFSEAHGLAMSAQEGKTIMYTSRGIEWEQFGEARRKRPLESVILDQGIKERIVNDVKDFLQRQKWYVDRGIPYRRGYLLYGPPGSGKSSFIQALAGELDFGVAIINLSERGITDDKLAHLLTKLPPRTILLLEDADAAFRNRRQVDADGYGGGAVTFSGLLNALDGVAAGEERIAFLTTNHIDRLDEALIRPGRVDMTVRIGQATRYQAGEMWDRFYGDVDKDGQGKNRFIQRLEQLGLVDSATEPNNNRLNTSTAAIQGLFLFNKDDMHGAIEMAERLIPLKYEPEPQNQGVVVST